LLLQDLHAETFAPHVDTSFHVSDSAARTMALRLARVDERTPSPAFEQFAVLFQGPADSVWGQGTYHFSHPALGEFDLFITPIVGSSAERMLYEACFNRRRVDAGR
jgi:hypothetical protein